MPSFGSTNPWVLLTAMLVAVAVLGAVRLLVQTPQALRPQFDKAVVAGTTPVVIALTDSLPSRDFDIVIKRRAAQTPHDVILVRPSALRPDLLATAIETLTSARRSFGRVPSNDVLFKVPPPGTKKPARSVEAEGWVKSLQAAKAMDLPGVGTVPIIMLHLFDRELASNS